ncbi:MULTISPECIES: 4Fe-4S dicluster domain-containing protein [Desulfobacula]|uniref:CooF: iron-sulfur protein of carbon monoxide dehydrogenase n=2 Tax=Desulfobacula TaxID=28222 RepID=K0NPB0_DESTT|nr:MULTISPECIES: 4Fe-4S dicluster domain-containing protein [Desulfobacula]CCK81968.1 CooF: iron-sulfur protein of carbon monoxide dehydrogenase [Desulfobacula toluolica Tol2]SDU43094.1 carbon-monoxide dehydrogenase iron sulfur subunit [Desulfobacula phenolica]
MKTVFVEVQKCVGCRHCEIACAVEHSREKALLSFLNDDPQSQPRIKVGAGIDFMTFPNRCRHCDPAPCLQICPTGAIYKDNEFGSVLVREERCISCGMCAMACPFSAITFQKTRTQNRSVSYKCDDCIDLRRNDLRKKDPKTIDSNKEEKQPACVKACKTGALVFGEINATIHKARRDDALDITGYMKGKQSFKMPENIKMFKGIMEKIACLGPMPSSR